MRSRSLIPIALLTLTLTALATPAMAADADSILKEFSDADTGIAFTMLSENSWKNPGNQNFHDDPATPQKKLQAVTISNAHKKLMPYQGDTRYGLVLSVAASSNFYQYFATKSAFDTPCDAKDSKMVTPITEPPGNAQSGVAKWAVSCESKNPGQQIALCARCFDGGPCAGSGNQPNTKDGLWPALGDQVSYSEFQKAMSKIVEHSGSTSTCTWATAPNIWNEFDTNGLSPTALAGVLIDHTTPPPTGSWTPPDATLCSYLTTVDSSRTKWPVYTLTWTSSTDTPSALALTRTLDCS